MAMMTYAEAAKTALAEAMRADERIWCVGEDLGRGHHAARGHAADALARERERRADVPGEAVALAAETLDDDLAHGFSETVRCRPAGIGRVRAVLDCRRSSRKEPTP